jgi:hypothetical protein
MVVYVIFILKCMGFASQKVWVMGYEGVWVMGSNSPPTNLVDQKFYGLWESMGYQSYGL